MAATTCTSVSGATHYGWSARTVTVFTLAVLSDSPPALAETAPLDPVVLDLVIKAFLALGTILIAQAIIPIGKAWFQKRKLRATYRSYLRAHLDNTLESFQGAGSTHFAHTHDLTSSDSDWFQFLHANDLGIPKVFLDTYEVIQKALASNDYIPSVSYFGLDGNTLDHTSPVWELNGPETATALKYFLTQRQIETSLDYQYEGWYFDLIRSGDPEKRLRWCKGLENVLFDMAQHYKAALELKRALDRLG